MTSLNETDDQLLQRYAQGGERGAMDELIRRPVDLVYAAARRQLHGDEHAAQDVTQAVFMLLLSKSRLVRRGSLAGWLLQTTRYAAANARKMLTRRVGHEREAAAQRTEAIVLPADQLISRDLDRSIAMLPRGEREAIALRYLEGRELVEVCQFLGLSESAARKRITRAIDRLRRILNEKGSTVIGETAVVAVLQSAASQKAPAIVQAAISKGVHAPLASEILKETAMQLLLLKIRTITAIALLCAGTFAGITELARRAYAEKPATNPVATIPPEQSIAPATTQPQDDLADLHRDQTNLLNIGGAINLYAAMNGGRFPDSLGATIPYIEDRAHWTKTAQPKATPGQKAALYLSAADLQKTQIPTNPTAKWIDEHTSDVYLLNSTLKTADFPGPDWGQTVAAHVKLDDGYVVIHPDKTRVIVFPTLFLDGHVESENREYVEKTIAASKKRIADTGGL